MGIDVHAYKTGIMIYMKDEWAEKKGRRVNRHRKMEYCWCCVRCAAVENSFDFGVFVCMYTGFIYFDRPLSFSQDDITNQEYR